METLPLRNKQNWLIRWLQLNRQLRRQLNDRYAAEGLNESRAFVLEAISRGSRETTQTNLATDLQLSESALCGLIERMRREGLLTRKRSTVDRRKTQLAMTPTGQELCLKIRQIHEQFEQDLEQQFASDEGLSLLNSLECLLTKLTRASNDVYSQRSAS